MYPMTGRVAPYLTLRRAQVSLASAMVIGVVGFLVRNVEISIISLLSSGGVVLSLQLVCPLLLAIITCAPWHDADLPSELAAVRRIPARDVALLGGVAATFAATIVACSVIARGSLGYDDALAAVRNLLALFAVYCVARVLTRPLVASLLMSAFALVCFMAGSRNGVPYWWAVLIFVQGSGFAWLMAGAWAAVAAAIYGSGARLRPPWRYL
ncbi:hypothetical protein JT358_16130 [Micrococcales bacterium 31B]|nr:hypothetical protein [Micrococcales bacterium 31B]